MKDTLSKSKVYDHLFDFLTRFLTNNYSSEYELQFTSYVVTELINYCVEGEDSTLESAEDALETYIRTYKQLENIVDIISSKFISSESSNLVVKGIKLAAKNIEFHPKIISVESDAFIRFIEKVSVQTNNAESSVSEEAKGILVSYIKRFPSTMREISANLQTRGHDVLAQLIIKGNETIHI